MKTLKRILATLLAIGMLSGCLVGLTGCGEDDDSNMGTKKSFDSLTEKVVSSAMEYKNNPPWKKSSFGNHTTKTN